MKFHYSPSFILIRYCLITKMVEFSGRHSFIVTLFPFPKFPTWWSISFTFSSKLQLLYMCVYICKCLSVPFLLMVCVEETELFSTPLSSSVFKCFQLRIDSVEWMMRIIQIEPKKQWEIQINRQSHFCYIDATGVDRTDQIVIDRKWL